MMRCSSSWTCFRIPSTKEHTYQLSVILSLSRDLFCTCSLNKEPSSFFWLDSKEGKTSRAIHYLGLLLSNCTMGSTSHQSKIGSNRVSPLILCSHNNNARTAPRPLAAMEYLIINRGVDQRGRPIFKQRIFLVSVTTTCLRSIGLYFWRESVWGVFMVFLVV